MNNSLTVGIAVVGGLLGLRLLSKARHEQPGSTMAGRMSQRLEKMIAKLPENSPPKLVMTVLPALRDQNEQILQMLREQNELLRQLRDRPH